MYPYAFLAVITAPLVLAAPAPVPAPFPKPQLIGDPVTGLLSGIGNAVLDIGSLSSAIPAVLSDIGQVSTAANLVVGM